MTGHLLGRYYQKVNMVLKFSPVKVQKSQNDGHVRPKCYSNLNEPKAHTLSLFGRFIWVYIYK